MCGGAATPMNSGPQGGRVMEGGMTPWSRSPTWIYLVFVLAPVVFVGLIAAQPWVPFEHLTRDPLIVAGECARYRSDLAAAGRCGSLYFGAVSNLGVLIWCSGVAVCLFAAAQLYRRGPDGRRGRAMPFMVYAGLFTAFLMLDDLFQLHEQVFPKLLGLSDFGTYGIYGVIALFYFALFWKQIVQHDVLLLGIGLLGLAASIGTDFNEMILGPRDVEGVGLSGPLSHWVVEDGGKLVGISAWTGFHVQAAWRALTPPADR